MPSDAEIFAKGTEVLAFGVEAAQTVAKTGMDGPAQMRLLSAGLNEDVMTGNGPRAVLDLLSIALIQLAQHKSAQEGGWVDA